MKSLGGSLAGAPSAVSCAPDRLDVFAAGPGNMVWCWWLVGGTMHGPGPLPVPHNIPAEGLCAISSGAGLVEVFAAGAGINTPLWWRGDTGSWRAGDKPLPTGANLLPVPVAAVCSGPNDIDVFAAGASNTPWWWHWNGTAWIGPVPLPLGADLPPVRVAAVSAKPGRLDVFAAGRNGNQLWHWSREGASAWSLNNRGGNLPAQGVSAVCWGPNRIDVFAAAQKGPGNNPLQHWWWDGSQFNGPEDLGGNLAAGTVSAVSPGTDRLDIFGISMDRRLGRWRWDGSRWSGPNYRGDNVPPGDVSAVIRAPYRVDVFVRGADNSLWQWPGGGLENATNEPWKNWAGNRETNALAGHCYPDSLEELVAIVKEAGQRGRSVRAVGSSWAHSDIAVTSAAIPGYVVETNKLDMLIPDTVVPNALLAAHPQPHHLVHVEAGIQLENLMTILDGPPARAPYTMGGAAGQTLAGVISTSVHGSHFRLPPFPDWVRAIHLVGPDGSQHWIEPDSQRITDKNKLQAALGPDVEIHYDDDWFDATLVAVGSLGIIYSVVLQVRDQYKLKETRTEIAWSMLRPQLVANGNVFKAHNDGVQVAIDPGSMGRSDPLCYLTERQTVPMTTASTLVKASFDPLAAFCEGDVILELLFEAANAVDPKIIVPALLVALPAVPAVVAVAGLFPPVMVALGLVATLGVASPLLIQLLKAAGPGAVGDVVGKVLDKHPELTSLVITEMTKQSQAQPAGPAVDIAHQVMARRNKGECAARGLALEIAFDTADQSHLQFIDAALAMLKDEAAQGRYLGGWFSIRFVGKSRAILSPQRTAMTCMVEAVGLRTLGSTKVLLARLEMLGRSFGGIQHWGMFDDLNAADVARAYPRLDIWLGIRNQLTNNGTIRTFDNDFSERCGLASPPRRGWSSLGGQFTSGPAVASFGANRLDVFARGLDNALWTNSWTGSDWTGWGGRPLAPEPIASDPAAVSWGPNRIDVFALGTDAQMYKMSWDGAKWTDWSPLGPGAKFKSGPAVASWGPGRLDVFARGLDDALWTNSWTGSDWTGWGGRPLAPEPIASDPAAVSWGPNRIDVFALGTDAQMYKMSWDGAKWTDWSPLGPGAKFKSGPAVASWGPGRLDVFARGLDDALWTNSWTGSDWTGWGGRPLAPEPIASDPAAVSWGPNRIDVFALGTDAQMYKMSWDGTRW